MTRCFYCLNDKLLNPVCLTCRTMLEALSREVKRLQKENEFLRLKGWKALRENRKG